jgi:hypothetical protein
MSDFWLYFSLGLKHVLNFNAYDHILFLLALSVPYEFKEWKRLLVLISFFTLGHTISLLLGVYNLVSLKDIYVDLLILLTILSTAVYNIISVGKSSKKVTLNFIAFTTLGFGIIHGLGFSSYFNNVLPGKSTEKLIPLFDFALGIEIAQISSVIGALLLAFVVQTLFKFSKRDWTLTLSAFIIGVIIPLLLQNEIWNN